MTSVMSKRQQARNERTLQDLLRSIPGNDVCADCQARNPGWASWSLGVFLCMRCASLHRKLGTHVSKVKSLSMDTWTSEQVESMKSNGNVAVNKTFNPRNVRPDIPLDADEVDSAMERFIRKKYQERNLSSGKPRILDRNPDTETGASRDESPPPPPLPPKKGKLFGFGLRASSAAYPSSKHDKKKLPTAPTFEGAFGIASTDFEGSVDDNHSQKAIAFHTALDNEDMRDKLRVLREMGFHDEQQNIYVLKRLNNRLELAVEHLIKHGKTKSSTGTARHAEPARKASTTFPQSDSTPAAQVPQPESNLFDRGATGDQVGLSFDSNTPQPHPQGSNPGGLASVGTTPSKNPFDPQPTQALTVASLEQSFQGMQLTHPLFPNTTGGYPAQSQPQLDPRFQHSMTPPVPQVPQQYGYVASPPAMNITSNPFFQGSQSSQPSFSNPYASAVQNQPTSSNPFFAQMSPSATTQQPAHQFQPTPPFQNPFGIPPSQPQTQQQQYQQQINLESSQSIFDQNQLAFYTNTNTPQYPNQSMPAEQMQSQVQPQTQLGSSNPFGNFQTPQAQPLFQQTAQPQFQPTPQPQQPQFQPQPQQPSQPQYNYQNHAQQPIYPQPTGRIDKNTILALYNYPHLAPQRPSLPSVSEDSDIGSGTTSPGPSTDLFSGASATSARRSVTMPVPSTSSATQTGSRNPFLNNNGGTGNGSPSPGVNGGVRHVSNESVLIASSDSGRHSPDAFANLSARYA